MKPILSIQSCFKETSVCIYKDGEFFEKSTNELNTQHELLPIFVSDLLKEHNIQICDLDSIVVCHGPGTFTGIRIGIAFALGLSIPFNLPIFVISALECFALESGKSTVVVKALKDTVYFQEFENGKEIGEILHINVEEVPNENDIIKVGFDAVGFPSAKKILQTHIAKKDKTLYIEPLYVRPVNATISQTKKFIK